MVEGGREGGREGGKREIVYVNGKQKHAVHCSGFRSDECVLYLCKSYEVQERVFSQLKALIGKLWPLGEGSSYNVEMTH